MVRFGNAGDLRGGQAVSLRTVLRPLAISLQDSVNAAELAGRLPNIRVLSGNAGLVELATLPEADIVLITIVGTAGLAADLAAIRAG